MSLEERWGDVSDVAAYLGVAKESVCQWIDKLMNIPIVPEEEGADPACKVRLIEEEFKRLMFDVKGI